MCALLHTWAHVCPHRVRFIIQCQISRKLGTTDLEGTCYVSLFVYFGSWFPHFPPMVNWLHHYGLKWGRNIREERAVEQSAHLTVPGGRKWGKQPLRKGLRTKHRPKIRPSPWCSSFNQVSLPMLSLPKNANKLWSHQWTNPPMNSEVSLFNYLPKAHQQSCL